MILNACLKVLLLLIAAAGLGVEGAAHGIKSLSLATKYFLQFAQVFVRAMIVVHSSRLVMTRTRWPETRL